MHHHLHQKEKQEHITPILSWLHAKRASGSRTAYAYRLRLGTLLVLQRTPCIAHCVLAR
jgi:hypothetical protein